jgi:putative transposase
MIDRSHPLPLTRQAPLLALSRSSLYYQPAQVSDADLALMTAIDEIHLELPFYGARRIRDELQDRGFAVGRDHVTTLMRTMDMVALYPKRRLSEPHPGHKIYPYLLRNKDITRAGEVWCADVTFLPMSRGFCYLVAIMDWMSRRVLSFRVSNTLDASFCVEALQEALDRYAVPEIMNTDQGSQFTSETFTSLLDSRGVSISMDGRGRWMDNVFIERLWRSVKYEEVYLKGYENWRPTSTSTTKGGGTKASRVAPLMRSTGLHYVSTNRQPDEQTITYELPSAVHQNPATSVHCRVRPPSVA